MLSCALTLIEQYQARIDGIVLPLELVAAEAFPCSTINVELDIKTLKLDAGTPIPRVVIVGFSSKKTPLEMIDSANGDFMYGCMEQS